MPDDKHIIRSVLGEPYYSRFWARVQKTDGCWLWRKGLSAAGYGRFQVGGKQAHVQMYTHILSYQMFVGKIPDGLQIDHLCRVRHCVNPEHLEAVTHKENILRGMSPMARQARQTHCLRGHSLVGGYVSPTGHRLCLTCSKLRQQRRRREAHIEREPQTHCMHGHSFAEGYINAKGHRICRICHNIRTRDRRAKRKQRSG